jgi:lipoprotein NlpI
MDIQDFLPKKNDTLPIIQKDVDAAKYDKVASQLCEKRKKLEDHLAQGELTDEDRAETLIEVARLRDSMKTFGITEVDYQAYLAYKASETGVQLELF